ncbi:hypothetical protein [Limosilactobacillus coleohominis]|uniref:hypothetical protein n=1 Tax=Limosilactobacillus coleohominis TaxID=181675 RepID=UPI002A91F7FF|nr:hypothetical protein [Limosilactobacillus coleohominis]MDY5628839.1 hypothetical protein [Limosilactobacillus coleohominis]
MRAVYVYDPETKKYLYPRVFEDNDNTVIPNSTTVPVPDDIWGDKTWDGQAWHGMTKEEYLKVNPPKPEPTATQLMLNTLGSQIAKGNQVQATTQQMINMLGQQVAQDSQTITQLKGMVNMLGQQVAKSSQEKAGN